MERGLKQYDIANQLGIGESKMSKIETGRIVPDPDLLGRIAEMLEVPPEDLRATESGA